MIAEHARACLTRLNDAIAIEATNVTLVEGFSNIK